MRELYELIHAIDLPYESHCLFRSNHISNYVALAGTLPQDKEKLLSDSKKAIEHLSTMTNWDPYNNVEQ
jgi:hypothetical protein